jgi:hypothetical protein
MRKRTHVPVFTAFDSIRISLAKLCLVLFWMVKILNSIVTAEASVTVLTLTIFKKIRTQFRYIVSGWSSSISLFSFVVVEALFRVVSHLYSTRLSFKCHQIQMQDRLLFYMSLNSLLLWLWCWTTVKALTNYLRQKTHSFWQSDFIHRANLKLEPQLRVHIVFECC